MSRREVDPSWDMGLGFEARASKAVKLTFPWQRGEFSFLSDKESDSEVQSLFGHLEPVALPQQAARQAVSFRVVQPRLRPLDCLTLQDAQSSC